jgi:SNF2 family DNA or RNA helicase
MTIMEATGPMVVPTAGNTHLWITTANHERIVRERPDAVVVGLAPASPVIQMPWTQEASEYLATIRSPVIPRMMLDYDWRTPDKNFKIMAHQYRMAGVMSTWRRGFCLGEPGVGKTLAALWAADYMIKAGRIKRVLIITLKGLMRPAWLADMSEHLPWMQANIVYSTDAKDRRRKARIPSQVHITNYTTAEIAHDELMDNGYDLVILDESTAIKTHTTNRARFLFPIVERAKYAWELTGTPAAQAPTDAYGQVYMMYGPSWGISADRFKQLTMVKVSQHKWVPVTNALEVVKQAMQPAISVIKRDVMPDMPEITKRTIDVDLSKEQRDAIKAIRASAQALLASGVQITAVHGAALRSKIVQMASGAVLDETGAAQHLDYKPRLEELLRLITEARALDSDLSAKPWNKVIVFCAFREVAKRVADDVAKAGFKTACVGGWTSLPERERILGKQQFNNTRDVEVVVAVPDVMSHGLTLTAANLTIWFTPIDKNEVVIQANNRMDRPGQKNPMQIVSLCGCSAEAVIYSATEQRQGFHDSFLSSYKQLVDAL